MDANEPFPEDSYVRLKQEVTGEDHETIGEHTMPAGSIGRVCSIDTLAAPQGKAYTVFIPLDSTWEVGIVNVFDEGDGPIGDFLEAVEETPDIDAWKPADLKDLLEAAAGYLEKLIEINDEPRDGHCRTTLAKLIGGIDALKHGKLPMAGAAAGGVSHG